MWIYIQSQIIKSIYILQTWTYIKSKDFAKAVSINSVLAWQYTTSKLSIFFPKFCQLWWQRKGRNAFYWPDNSVTDFSPGYLNTTVQQIWAPIRGPDEADSQHRLIFIKGARGVWGVRNQTKSRYFHVYIQWLVQWEIEMNT